MASNINQGMHDMENHRIPADSNRQPILAARKFMTRQITLVNTNRLQIYVPRGCYEAVLRSSSAVTVYEASATYTEVDGGGSTITYGTGIAGTVVTIPCENMTSFYISGATSQVVDIMFPSLRS